MSTPNDHSSTSNYLCHNCGTININGTRCIQCQSEFLEETSTETHNTQQLSNDNDHQQIPSIHDFENLFNNTYDIQSFTNTLLPMLMSQTQTDISQHRHRRGRPPRRIKRITHSLPRHRYIPFLDFLPFQVINTQASQISLLNINGLVSRQPLNTQYEPNMALVQLPLHFLVFDHNGENFNPDLFIQMLNDDIRALPLTRNDINELPTLTMTPSNLSINPSCAICLENFNPLSEVKQLPICHHVFHTNCLTEWLLRHGNCPMCRTTLVPSIQRTPTSIFNNQWMQQLFSRTFGQPQQQSNVSSSNTVVSYSPIKTINSLETSSNILVSDHSSSDTPQLPHFDSQTHNESSSNIE
ncbi:unnamed protein product [Rotaria sp. Silwood1]|nr:unnamed protein product [Rotaria sp. Silwood1]CAF0948116.1 unnamed protein product [Rotaria sp. Silwood1]CAF3360856.1 unnamed protein product [Rotaria sp. Silwood1]CAF3396236.1 unnamed protein product [Rotaria sp. Silwood1]CAF3399577.1 unnamed protein product [Rotaria sp. Silwood1]